MQGIPGNPFSDQLRLVLCFGAHLGFGFGEHYCLGAALARAEIEEALPLLARRLTALGADGPARWRTGAQIRGPEQLPIRFERRD